MLDDEFQEKLHQRSNGVNNSLTNDLNNLLIRNQITAEASEKSASAEGVKRMIEISALSNKQPKSLIDDPYDTH